MIASAVYTLIIVSAFSCKWSCLTENSKFFNQNLDQNWKKIKAEFNKMVYLKRNFSMAQYMFADIKVNVDNIRLCDTHYHTQIACLAFDISLNLFNCIF